MKFGKPDYFITITANPNSTQIKRNLYPNQSSWDRFDVVNDVFDLNVMEFFWEIKTKKIFGDYLAHTGVIENQKRGLPHLHVLIYVDSGSKPDTIKKIDEVVWAHIPDSKIYPKLYENVIKYNLHRPCEDKPNSVCYRNNKCSKSFPKKYQKKKEFYNGFVIYKRKMKHSIKLNNQTISDNYVVPYNPYLTRRFNCHINVEICGSILSCKYLHKYVHKENPKAIVEIEDQLNEIKTYQENRYISSVDAYARIKSYKNYFQYPHVIKLPVHLENEQIVQYDPDEDLRTILEENRKTKLTDKLIFILKH